MCSNLHQSPFCLFTCTSSGIEFWSKIYEFRIHEIRLSCQTWPTKFGQILIRTNTRLVFWNRKLMRTTGFQLEFIILRSNDLTHKFLRPFFLKGTYSIGQLCPHLPKTYRSFNAYLLWYLELTARGHHPLSKKKLNLSENK